MNTPILAMHLDKCKLGEPGSVSDSLAAEINALHHELRRVRDGLDRLVLIEVPGAQFWRNKNNDENKKK